MTFWLAVCSHKKVKFTKSPFHLKSSLDSFKTPEETHSIQHEVEIQLEITCHVGERWVSLWINPQASLLPQNNPKANLPHQSARILPMNWADWNTRNKFLFHKNGEEEEKIPKHHSISPAC